MEGRGCRDNWGYEQDWEKKGNRKRRKPCKAEEQEIVENKETRESKQNAQQVWNIETYFSFIICRKGKNEMEENKQQTPCFLLI